MASHGFQVYKYKTWENVNTGQDILVKLETNEDSKKINPYFCAIKTIVSGKLETLDQIPDSKVKTAKWWLLPMLKREK